MNLVFKYIKYPGTIKLVPVIKAETDNKKEQILISYITDDGGGALNSHIEFLTNVVVSLENSSTNFLDLSSNSYGAEIYNEFIKIYFLFDEDSEYVFKRADVLKLIELWIYFLKREPDQSYEEKHFLLIN